MRDQADGEIVERGGGHQGHVHHGAPGLHRQGGAEVDGRGAGLPALVVEVEGGVDRAIGPDAGGALRDVGDQHRLGAVPVAETAHAEALAHLQDVRAPVGHLVVALVAVQTHARQHHRGRLLAEDVEPVAPVQVDPVADLVALDARSLVAEEFVVIAGLGRHGDLADAPERATHVFLLLPGAALLDRHLGVGPRRNRAPGRPTVDEIAVRRGGAEVGQEGESVGAAVTVAVEELGGPRGISFPHLQRTAGHPQLVQREAHERVGPGEGGGVGDLEVWRWLAARPSLPRTRERRIRGWEGGAG